MLSKRSTISEASQRRFSYDGNPPPQPCSTAMRRAGQSSRRAITPRAKRMRAGLGAAGCGVSSVAFAVEVDAIVRMWCRYSFLFLCVARTLCACECDDSLAFVERLNGQKKVCKTT